MIRMKSSHTWCGPAAFLILCVGPLPAMQGQLLTEPQEPPPWLKPWTRPVVQPDYNSPGNIHKLDLSAKGPASVTIPLAERPKVFKYDERRLVVVNERPVGVALRDELNLIRLRDRFIDTTVDPCEVPKGLRLTKLETSQLHLVQFVGPPQSEWLRVLRNINKPESKDPNRPLLEIVSYVPENAYLVWANRFAREELERQVKRRSALPSPLNYFQWEGPFHPAYKLHPGFDLSYPGDVEATVQLFYLGLSDKSLPVLGAKAIRIIHNVRLVGPYANLTIEVPASELENIARLENVVNVEPYLRASPMCERQCQILAGNLDAAGFGPVGPGYLAWLHHLGFTSNFGFVVDVADTGFDRGETGAKGPDQVHPVFRDANGSSRIAYVRRISGRDAYLDGDDDTDGHGTLDASIVGGFADLTVADPGYLVDSAGFLHGLGIAPYVLLGATEIFEGAEPDYTTAIDLAYADGARISSNSWCLEYGTGDYDEVSQRYDYLVRDARPLTASSGGQEGYQEMVIVFAAGNSGPDEKTLGNQGAAAKNTLVVGACENYNFTGDNDGSLTPYGDQEANSADEVISFSSRGPTSDGRKKPDLMAPGTHVYGAASQDPNFDGKRIAGAQGNHTRPPQPRTAGAEYYPAGQTLYTWSSGTSHAAPAVAGGAALLRQWFINKGYAPPSPAMTKAYLMNSATYMKGPGDNLPSDNQGMGRMDLGRAFDDVPRVLFDQASARIFCRTGTGAADRFTVTGRIADANHPFRVTMAYTDAPGEPYVEKILQNDLDLQVVVGGRFYRGNDFRQDVSQPSAPSDPPDALNTCNNVESVFLPAGTTGEFTVTILPTLIAADALNPYSDNTRQDFALVIYNAEDTTHQNPVVDCVLALDLSGSMQETAAGGTRPKIDLLKDAVELFLRTWEPFARPSDRLAIVGFSNAASTYPMVSSGPGLLPFQQNADRFIEYVRQQTAGGCTTLGGGILTALRSFDHEAERQRQIIVVTNDMQNRSPMVTSVYPSAHQILADPEAPGGASGILDEPDVDLNQYDVEAIHIVGTGTPGDWTTLLAEIASESGGQCRFTTTPDKDLEGLLLENLAAVLQLDSLASAEVATGTLGPRHAVEAKVFPINTTVRRVTFVVSWTGVRDPDAVNVTLRAPDGWTLPPHLIGLRRGSFYQVLSVAFPLSGHPHTGLWTVTLVSAAQDEQALVYRIRNLVDDDSIQCQVSIPTANLRVGELLPISLSLRQGNRVLRDLQNVRATITRPSEGFGTFMVNHRASLARLAQPRMDLSGDPFPNPARQGAYFLLHSQDPNLRELLPPPVTENVRLYDDGQLEHGDTRRDDGVFSALYNRTSKPGLYDIELSVRHEVGQDIIYRKESRTVAVEIGLPDPSKSTITVRPVENSQDKPSDFEVTVTYIDKYGNHLGPGHGDLTATLLVSKPDKWATKPVPLHDNLDGSYSGRLGPVVHPSDGTSPPTYVRIEMGGVLIGEKKLSYMR